MAKLTLPAHSSKRTRVEILEPGGAWLGEDMSICRRLEGVTLEALITGETTHAGVRLELGAIA